MLSEKIFLMQNVITFTNIVILLCLSDTLCIKCMDKEVRSNITGEFLIAGIFPMNCTSASEIDNRTIGWMEALKYTIEKVNRLHNRSIFGYVIYDSHDSSNFDMTTDAVTNALLSSDNYSTCSCSNTPNNFLGFVGPAESSNSIYVHELASYFGKIPIISYGATSLELNDTELYPNFFRTVPSDASQAQLIADVLTEFHWTYISVIAMDNSYGRAGADRFKEELIKKDQICIDLDLILPVVYDNQYEDIIERLNKSKTNVIVVWGQFKPVQNLLQKAQSKNMLANRTWILSEAVGKNSWFLKYNNTLNNTFLLVVQTEGIDEGFKQHFFSLTYRNSSQWLKVVFEKNGVNESTPNFNVGNISKTFDLSRALFVQNAVKVLVKAFFQYQRNYSSALSSNSYQFIDDRTKFNEKINEVSFSFLNKSKTFTFHPKYHFAALASFELYSVNVSDFVLAASWTSSNLFNNSFKIKNNESVKLFEIHSFCSSPCPLGTKKTSSNPSKCCWTCDPCEENYITNVSDKMNCHYCDVDKDLYSNQFKNDCRILNRLYWEIGNSEYLIYEVFVLLSSGVGGLTVIIFMTTFIKKKLTPIVRSSNYELSLAQMMMHLIWFILPLLAFGDETESKCFIRIYFGSFLHINIITIVLVKVARLVAVFNLGTNCKLSKKEMLYIRSRVVILLIFFPCVYVAIIFVVHYSIYKVETAVVKDKVHFTIHKHCNSASFSLVYLCYTLALSIFCGFQTFKGKNLPWKYNETSYIAYSLLLSNITLSVMVGLIQSNLGWSDLKFAHCILTNTTNYLLMTILFINKIKIIWINPKKNSRAEFRKVSFTSIFSNDSQCSTLPIQNNSDMNEPNVINSVTFSLNEINSTGISNFDPINIVSTDFRGETEKEIDLEHSLWYNNLDMLY